MSFAVGTGLVVRGELLGEGDVQLAGQFEGKIDLTGTVVVSEAACIQADISATEIVVGGSVHGNVNAFSKVELAPTGHVRGSVRSKVLVVREGGRVTGRILTGALASPAEALVHIAE